MMTNHQLAEEMFRRQHGHKPWYQRYWIWTKDAVSLTILLVLVLIILGYESVRDRFRRKW